MVSETAPTLSERETVQPASAAVPGEEEVERIIRAWQMTPGFDGWDAKVAALVASLSALFAPILAEKERRIREMAMQALADDQQLTASLDRALAAEAALAAERERCARWLRTHGTACQHGVPASASQQPSGRGRRAILEL